MPKESGLINIESIPHDDESPPQNIDPMLEWFHLLVSKNLTKIVEKLSDPEYPVKVLVFDSMATWAIDLAHQLGLKGAAFFTQSCSLSAIYYHMDLETTKVSLDGSDVSLPSLPLLAKEDLPSIIYDTDLYPTLRGLIFSQNINFKKADWLFFNTFNALEKEVVDWIRPRYPIKTIGPTIPSMYLDKRLKDDKEYGLSLFKPNSETCMKWLDSKEIGSVVYVSFGSLASLDEQQMEELALGLIMSKCYFLWVVRATEENKLPEEFMSKLSEKGLMVNWCPQLDVLAHRAIGCFFTHSGWNSTLEALSLGVPMFFLEENRSKSNHEFVQVVDWIRPRYPIKTIGPTIPSMYLDKRLKDDKEYGLSLFKPNSETCMKWLDSKEIGSVVYVSFGSLASLDEQQMEELALGLIMSKCYFLWVVRATEENKLPEEFMSKLSEKGLMVNWCPQLDVLAHRAIGCFFTHSGWNSTLEALSLGVPMVTMPQWSDQPTNAKFISDVWQTGVRVKVGENGVVNRDEIASSIREVMEEEKGIMLKENAMKWKKLAKEAVDEGGSSDKNIEEFLSNL
ncbi:UDP-glycosyltransferase 74E1-like [Solanum tuberosum]|uniref:UDP-glycosyltransferase 74E1-like n=1 Tax=Solanum tuberosum TaxID=4113 RepID=UPI00073A258E|nr:PREDICTED: UDP-glycosyltransferase 74E1-like [Solanum tuberosum]